MLYRPTPFLNTFLTVEWHRRFLNYSFFFQKKTLGDISFKLETEIMNFMMNVFFRKKYNQDISSVVNNMQYNLFTIFPLSGTFAEFGFVLISLFRGDVTSPNNESVILGGEAITWIRMASVVNK